MTVYRRILLVVDLTEDSLILGRRAAALAGALGAGIELLHVVEFIPVEPMGDRKSTRLNSSHKSQSRMPSSA